MDHNRDSRSSQLKWEKGVLDETRSAVPRQRGAVRWHDFVHRAVAKRADLIINVGSRRRRKAAVHNDSWTACR